MHSEKTIQADSGWPMLAVNLAGLFGGTVLLIATAVAESGPAGPLLGLLIIFAAMVSLAGHFTLQPNKARVLILFGDYRGTVRQSGFHWTNPFYTKRCFRSACGTWKATSSRSTTSGATRSRSRRSSFGEWKTRPRLVSTSRTTRTT